MINMVILKKRVAGVSESGLTRFAERAKRALRVAGTVNVLVSDGRELKRLNRRFRGKNYPTDVLSFPVACSMDRLAGDIAIAADIARENARRLGHTPAQELKILVLHGLLHLAGYDHEQDDGQMAREEERLRKALKLPIGLIERSRPTGRRNARPALT
jgi:probable rRNA maturation factor